MKIAKGTICEIGSSEFMYAPHGRRTGTGMDAQVRLFPVRFSLSAKTWEPTGPDRLVFVDKIQAVYNGAELAELEAVLQREAEALAE